MVYICLIAHIFVSVTGIIYLFTQIPIEDTFYPKTITRVLLKHLMAEDNQDGNVRYQESNIELSLLLMGLMLIPLTGEFIICFFIMELICCTSIRKRFIRRLKIMIKFLTA